MHQTFLVLMLITCQGEKKIFFQIWSKVHFFHRRCLLWFKKMKWNVLYVSYTDTYIYKPKRCMSVAFWPIETEHECCCRCCCCCNKPMNRASIHWIPGEHIYRKVCGYINGRFLIKFFWSTNEREKRNVESKQQSAVEPQWKHTSTWPREYRWMVEKCVVFYVGLILCCWHGMCIAGLRSFLQVLAQKSPMETNVR